MISAGSTGSEDADATAADAPLARARWHDRERRILQGGGTKCQGDDQRLRKLDWILKSAVAILMKTAAKVNFVGLASKV